MTTLALLRFASPAELEAALTQRLLGALAARGPSAIMLSGGSTPMPAYRAAAHAMGAHDDRLHVLFSDDRYVPADALTSNYFQTRPLLDALDLPPESLLRVRTQLPLEEAAQDYDRQLAALLSAGVHIGLGLLGLGADGHTASLFSPADLARARGRYAVAVRRPDAMAGVSVTPELLATVREPVFVVAGPDKATAVQRLVEGDPTLVAWQAVQGCERVELWVA
jgi:6-phosphogluconolactonase/glucosamine-6-phosphate isomerase/deaminase